MYKIRTPKICKWYNRTVVLMNYVCMYTGKLVTILLTAQGGQSRAGHVDSAKMRINKEHLEMF